MKFGSTAAAFLSLAVIFVSGCKLVDPPLKSDPSSIDAISGQWQIERVNGVLVSLVIPSGGRAATLTLEIEGSFTAFAGINRLNGTVNTNALGDGIWEAGPVVTTKMAGPPELMELEQSVLSALAESQFVWHVDDALLLKRDGVYVLTLRRPVQ